MWYAITYVYYVLMVAANIAAIATAIYMVRVFGTLDRMEYKHIRRKMRGDEGEE